MGKVSNTALKATYKDCFSHATEAFLAEVEAPRRRNYLATNQETLSWQEKTYLELIKILRDLCETEGVQALLDLYSGDGLAPGVLLKTGVLKKATIHDAVQGHGALPVARRFIKRLQLTGNVTFVDAHLSGQTDEAAVQKIFAQAPNTLSVINTGFALSPQDRRPHGVRFQQDVGATPHVFDDRYSREGIKSYFDQWTRLTGTQKTLLFVEASAPSKKDTLGSPEALGERTRTWIHELTQGTPWALDRLETHEAVPAVVSGVLKRSA